MEMHVYTPIELICSRRISTLTRQSPSWITAPGVGNILVVSLQSRLALLVERANCRRRRHTAARWRPWRVAPGRRDDHIALGGCAPAGGGSRVDLADAADLAHVATAADPLLGVGQARADAGAVV